MHPYRTTLCPAAPRTSPCSCRTSWQRTTARQWWRLWTKWRVPGACASRRATTQSCASWPTFGSRCGELVLPFGIVETTAQCVGSRPRASLHGAPVGAAAISVYVHVWHRIYAGRQAASFENSWLRCALARLQGTCSLACGVCCLAAVVVFYKVVPKFSNGPLPPPPALPPAGPTTSRCSCFC